jgi:glycine/D-amino acid oxidase-like deaminating enzyme
MKLLLIGQGIAGTLLAWTFQKRGALVHLADGNLPGSSSLVAAGIINPVTGKRFVKSWRFDEFFPTAKSAYQNLEKELGIGIWSELPIVRLLATPEESNDWSARCALPDYASHLSESDRAGDWADLLKPGFRAGIIHRAARVDFPVLISALRRKAHSEGIFFQKNIEYETVEKLADEYEGIIFCEGYRGQENPFFPNLPWQLAKGEALLLRFRDDIQTASISQMLKKTMTLVPVGNNLFWAGGSYQWHFNDLLPSEGEKNYILNHLAEMLAVPFEIVDHVAGVRPTVKDRRPFIGQSPVHPKVFIFNGLGTKGALLTPYWAEHFTEYLLEGKSLDGDVDVQRFVSKS